MNNLQELYVFENGKVIRLEEQVKDLRRELVKQRIEFDEELIDTIEGMEEEKYMWKRKYEEVLKLTEILIAEFDYRASEERHSVDGTTDSHVNLRPTGETDESIETDATTEARDYLHPTGETDESIETDATTDAHDYLPPTGETEESIETDGTTDSHAYLLPTGETEESSPRHSTTSVRSNPIARILRRLFICGGENVQYKE